MDIEVLVVPDCPHAAGAERLVHAALAELGLEAAVSTTVVGDDEQAVRRGFTGSPTIRIDGVDPFADPGQPAGLACRRYRSADGPAGTPAFADLRDALARAAGGSATLPG